MLRLVWQETVYAVDAEQANPNMLQVYTATKLICSKETYFEQRRLNQGAASAVPCEPSHLYRGICRGGLSCLYKWFFKGGWLYQPSLKMILFSEAVGDISRLWRTILERRLTSEVKVMVTVLLLCLTPVVAWELQNFVSLARCVIHSRRWFREENHREFKVWRASYLAILSSVPVYLVYMVAYSFNTYF